MITTWWFWVGIGVAIAALVLGEVLFGDDGQ